MSNRRVLIFLVLTTVVAVAQLHAAITITSSPTLPGGVVGTTYNQSLAAIGGTPPYSWAVTSGSLPGGLVLLTSGSFLGAPTAAGAFTFSASVTDGAGASASSQFSLTVISWISCTYSIGPATASYASQGGSATVNISTQSGCPWASYSSLSWATITTGGLGSGNGSTTIQVAANTDPGARTGTVNVAGQSFSITQSGTQPNATCTYSMYPAGQAFASAGGNGTITITAATGCAWTVTGQPSWVTIASGASGSGNGTVTYTAAANAGAWRSATFTVAGALFAVEQSSASISGLTTIGGMPHVADSGGWQTNIMLVNNGTGSAKARLNFFDDSGAPFLEPVCFPQAPLSGTFLAPQLERTLAPGAAVIVRTCGSGANSYGTWAQLQSDGNITAFARFNWAVAGGTQEALVPLESRSPSSFVLWFDQSDGFVTGVALANMGSSGATIAVTVRDDTGAVIASNTLPTLNPNGHTSFLLTDTTAYPVTAGKRGTVEFKVPAGGQIATLAFRAAVGTLSTIPAMIK